MLIYALANGELLLRLLTLPQQLCSYFWYHPYTCPPRDNLPGQTGSGIRVRADTLNSHYNDKP